MQEEIHPVLHMLRRLRKASGLSLTQAGIRLGLPSIVLGSYERGDRNPPLGKVEAILSAYGYTLRAVPIKEDAVRLPEDMAAELRLIANQIGGVHEQVNA